MKNTPQKQGEGRANKPCILHGFWMIFRGKKGHVGADLGTFQQAHVAKTILFTMFFVEFRGVAFTPQKWTKWSRRSRRWYQDGSRVSHVGCITQKKVCPCHTSKITKVIVVGHIWFLLYHTSVTFSRVTHIWTRKTNLSRGLGPSKRVQRHRLDPRFSSTRSFTTRIQSLSPAFNIARSANESKHVSTFAASIYTTHNGDSPTDIRTLEVGLDTTKAFGKRSRLPCCWCVYIFLLSLPVHTLLSAGADKGSHVQRP